MKGNSQLSDQNASILVVDDLPNNLQLLGKILDVIALEIVQVFQNLMSNALDAMTQQPKAVLTIESGTREDRVWFSVCDNGPGIPQENLSKIYRFSSQNRFHQLDLADKSITLKRISSGLGHSPQYLTLQLHS